MSNDVIADRPHQRDRAVDAPAPPDGLQSNEPSESGGAQPFTPETAESTTPSLTHVSASSDSAKDSRRKSAMRAASLNLQSPLQLDARQEMIRIISNRLFLALFCLMGLAIAGGYLSWQGADISAGATNWMVILCGAIGGFISLQRRLKTFEEEDLLLLARSWVYVLLSPLVGSILAILLYFLFISGLLEGDLFPDFATSGGDEIGAFTAGTLDGTASKTGMTVLFQVQGVGYKDYAKLVFWCFVAGYSESFVTNIISHFESSANHQASSERPGE